VHEEREVGTIGGEYQEDQEDQEFEEKDLDVTESDASRTAIINRELTWATRIRGYGLDDWAVLDTFGFLNVLDWIGFRLAFRLVHALV